MAGAPHGWERIRLQVGRSLDRRGGAPRRRALVVTPATRPVERVHADAGELAHGTDPPRTHPVGVVVRGLADLRQPDLAVEGRLGDARRAVPCILLGDHVRNTVTREGELAAKVPARG